jgi:hypothetical protein
VRTFLWPNSVLTGENTGNFEHLAAVDPANSRSESALAKKVKFSRPIETGNDQGRNGAWRVLIWGRDKMGPPLGSEGACSIHPLQGSMVARLASTRPSRRLARRQTVAMLDTTTSEV